jgi:D-alanyl-D-alanine dipeptidase
MPRVGGVREIEEGTRVSRAHFNVHAIGEIGPFDLYETPELVDVVKMDPTILTESYWTRADTFMGRAIYEKPRFLLRPAVAEAIVRINQSLRAQNLRLKLYDAYRPLSISQILYRKLPNTPYLAAPNRGSRHNRGAAVDCTITDMDGRELEMQSIYLTMGEAARRDYLHASPTAVANREFLTSVMAGEGFTTIPSEWWHYDAPNWEKYPVMNVPLWPTEKDRGRTARILNDPDDVGSRMFEMGKRNSASPASAREAGDRLPEAIEAAEMSEKLTPREIRYAQMFDTGLPESKKSDAESGMDVLDPLEDEEDSLKLPESIEQFLNPVDENQATPTPIPFLTPLPGSVIEAIPDESGLKIPARRGAFAPEEESAAQRSRAPVNRAHRVLRRVLPAAMADAIWSAKWIVLLAVCVLFSGVMFLRSRQ